MRRIRLLPASKYLKTFRYASADAMARDCRYPVYCSFKVIQRCDSSCDFCNIWKSPMPDMPTEKVLRIVDNVAKSSILLLSLEGGEPLLRSDIGEILKYIRTKPLYVLFTTSGKLFDSRPMKEYARYIDFLHISIDEGHKNMKLFDRLSEFVSWGPVVSVQIVVMKEYLSALEEKIKKCHEAGAKAVVMPACHLSRTPDYLPDIHAFRDEVFRLKKKYPRTIVTTDQYLNTLDVPHSCNTSSVIINYDGRLYYPCMPLQETSMDASERPLLEFLRSDAARQCRLKMQECEMQCHWYQYFATGSFLSVRSGLSALSPFFENMF